MHLYCCECQGDVESRLTNGAEIYPHREDLAHLPFWKCDTCKNHVGCHHKTSNTTAPLGCIPNAEMRIARSKLHELIDPIWQSGAYSRKELYKKIAKKMGLRSFHIGGLRTMERAREAYRIILDIAKSR